MKDLDAVEGTILDVPARCLVSLTQGLQQWASDLAEADHQHRCLAWRIPVDDAFAGAHSGYRP
jgi:hypothetical protein